MTMPVDYPHTVTVTGVTGLDQWGAEVTAAPVAVACMIAEEVKLIRAADGADVISGTQLYAGLDAAPVLVAGARVTIPADTHRPAPTLVSVASTQVLAVGDPDNDGVTAWCV